MKKIFFSVLFIILGVFTLFSQIQEGKYFDRIVAKVGDELITFSDVQSQIYLLAQQNPEINLNDEKIFDFVLNQMINEKLILAKAIEDSITVTDDEVEQRWNYQLKAMVQHYGSERRIEELYGLPISSLKTLYRDEIRKALLIDKMKEKKLGSITVTPREVRDFYEMYKDSLPKIPTQVELYHIVKNIETPQNIKELKYNLAIKVRDSIVKTGDFDKFASVYSDDPNTKFSGGEIGWVARGRFFPEFEQVAFSLQRNEISPPVETPLGYHLIQVLNKSKDSVFVRHILFRIMPSFEEIEKVKSFLRELKERFYKGENFEELAYTYSEDYETRGIKGYLGKFTFENIPISLKGVLDTLEVGAVSDPILYRSHPQESYRIVWKKRVIPEHFPDINEDYKEIEQFALSYKQQRVFNEWVTELRQKIYWEIIK